MEIEDINWFIDKKTITKEYFPNHNFPKKNDI
jgi:hypothetical protein